MPPYHGRGARPHPTSTPLLPSITPRYPLDPPPSPLHPPFRDISVTPHPPGGSRFLPEGQRACAAQRPGFRRFFNSDYSGFASPGQAGPWAASGLESAASVGVSAARAGGGMRGSTAGQSEIGLVRRGGCRKSRVEHPGKPCSVGAQRFWSSGMTAQEFRVWQARVGIRNGDLAKRLGKGADTISVWRTNGVGERDSQMVRLALSAIEQELGTKK